MPRPRDEKRKKSLGTADFFFSHRFFVHQSSHSFLFSTMTATNYTLFFLLENKNKGVCFLHCQLLRNKDVNGRLGEHATKGEKLISNVSLFCWHSHWGMVVRQHFLFEREREGKQCATVIFDKRNDGNTGIPPFYSANWIGNISFLPKSCTRAQRKREYLCGKGIASPCHVG
mmetsp:Transcript_1201/g.3101  ORF Transcript_1201/g.3101 Transcript_1201/m.3101 type:complete len:172 (-) Transcript_1201:928-1443(-)